MRTIRASELGSFLFCARAWWYQLQGVRSLNQHQLNSGTEFHHRHSRKVLSARLLTTLGWVLLLGAIIFLTIGLTIEWLK
jgi:hypothetical protein